MTTLIFLRQELINNGVQWESTQENIKTFNVSRFAVSTTTNNGTKLFSNKVTINEKLVRKE